MSELSDDYRLPRRSIPEVREKFDQALLHHQKGRRIKFKARNITGEAMVNAVILHFLDLDPEDQKRVLVEYVPRFAAMVTGGENEARGAAADDAAPAAPGETVVAAPGVAADAGRRKRKRGG